MTPETPGRRRARRPSEGRPGEPSERRRERRAQGAQAGSGASRALLVGAGELLAIGTEMLRIPAEMALGLAERLGLLVLATWRFLRPLLVALLILLRKGLAIAERELTPLRAVVGVLVAAAILLAVSQFLDYRDVRAGVPAYQDVELVAPPPEVTGSTRTTGSAHAYVLFTVALGVLVLLVLALRGRWRLARLIAPLGLVVVAVAALIDAPKGLDEGLSAIQFEGTEARLLGPFWVELVAGAVIAVCGVLLALQLRPERTPGAAREPTRSRRSGLRGSPVQGARP